MKNIWDFFENMDEYLYVSDMDSNELIYLNKKARETYSVPSLNDIAGKKCYEVIHNCSAPCSICHNHELCPGQFKEWTYYSPILEKYIVIKETIVVSDGRRCHVKLGLDASNQEWKGIAAHTFQNLETIVNEGLRVALQAPTPDMSISVILEYLGKALNAERTYIFEKNVQGRDDNTYEWVANGVTPEKDHLQNVPSEVCASWYNRFREGKHIVIDNLEKIKVENPMQYEVLKGQDIHSLVVVPLYDDRKVIGFYGVDNPPAKSLDYTSNMLQIMGHFIVSALKRRNLMKELRDMSYCDYLTKLGNRHAMNEYVTHMKCDVGIGGVYCDVTGLKQINDTEGHKAGDDLLIRASESLKRVFGPYGLFRIGGDEFLALCEEIEEEVLYEKVELLKRDILEHSVAMAVGAVWEKNSDTNMDRLLVEAEKRMYQDKAEYYKKSGIDRRR